LGETYNIGGGAEMANIDLIGVLCDEIDRRFAADKALATRFPRCPAARGSNTRELITFVKDRPGHDRRYAICADKLARELGFCAGTPLTDGLRRTVDWYLSNERWWRAVQTGAYRDWMKLQYGAALTGSIT
jgi:dTDP-glucose 4,6-dehydratase